MNEEAIIISWPEDYEDNLAEEILSFSNDDFKIGCYRTEDPGVLAALEWAIPTAFIVYLFGNFFKSFMSEAGKDGYAKTKSLLKKYIKHRREQKTKLIAATASTEKLSRHYDQSLTISLAAKFETHLDIIVLFSEKAQTTDVDPMLEGMFQSLMFLYGEFQKQAQKDEAKVLRKRTRLYMIVNLETQKWELLTAQQMSEKYRNQDAKN
ncbi:MAG: hypothetical protein ACTHJ8_03885 [Mucilaginibacter sp.]